MKKVLLVADCMLLSKGAVRYACYLAKMSSCGLAAVLVKDEDFMEMRPEYKSVQFEKNSGQLPVMLKNESDMQKLVETSMHDFLALCEKEGVAGSIYHAAPVTPEEMIEESRFSDLIVVDAGTFLTDKIEQIPSPFLQYLLANAICPVLITPPVFHLPQEIVFCYDWHDDAMVAIKQFTLLLPFFGDNKVTVLIVKENGEKHSGMVPRMRDWLGKYYSQVAFRVLEGDPYDQLFSYLMKSQRTLVVMGAYGRSMISRFFYRSHADLLIRSLAFPIFIAHS
ncbi:hypothetical protein SAMN05444266_104157 [Chitinophaga jiangningensis]|uniref:Universal stress protein family protein n=1 Tax=Chitinophaga jiangningensis TaxID=1419482 RepID=A0A1M7C1H2_9BACT|nr:universal stress protein [Chitinophaga jiangningensis]SHL61054.1 hypothetical protein SAMN05444266_104157 [Chitinophaga jiangningensis]